MKIRQQPQFARACGYGTKDRRSVDPAPILEVLYNEETPMDTNFLFELHPFLVVQATLWSINQQQEPEQQLDKYLSGAIVSNASILRDHTGALGCFFTFADISVREKGSYRLQFSLYHLRYLLLISTKEKPVGKVITTVFSQVIRSFTPKDYPGMQEPSELIRSFASQGLPMPIRKTRASEDPDSS